MKKVLALILAFTMLLSGCSERSPSGAPVEENNPAQSTEDEKPAEKDGTPSSGKKPDKTPSEEKPTEEDASKEDSEKNDTEENNEKEDDTEKEENPKLGLTEDEKAAADDNAGVSESGTFYIMDSGYQITLNQPFLGIYDKANDGMFISAIADSDLIGIISYIDDPVAVAGMEENVTFLNETLKADDSVRDFKFDRWRDAMGLYCITFSYYDEGDEYSSKGYNYVLYRETDEGMITVMFSCSDKNYADPVNTVFNSVIPATDDAKDPPER